MKTKLYEGDITPKLYHWIQSEYRHHIVVPNVYVYSWESDLISVSKRNIVHEYEIKTRWKDFKNDAKKASRHKTLTAGVHPIHANMVSGRPNYFWYVAPELEVMVEDVPAHAGLIGICQLSHLGKMNGMVFRVLKKAPALHRVGIDQEKIRRMLVSMSYKYWDCRHNHG